MSRLLDDALALDATERDGWLQSLQEENANLAPVLREMLSRAEQTSGHLLDKKPRLREEPPLQSVGAGEQVGPYRLLRELGRGGMGTVWLAERADGSLKRQIALKLPRLAWEAGLGQRMRRERDILAVLEHPNIARLYDAGVDALGRPYLALEYVEGEPIDRYCRAHQLTLAQRLQLFLQVARAVAHAHARLIVHRDLKPSNILVAADGTVRLLDFGIAKLLEGDTAQATELTALAGRALTPDYASPEQIRGEPITVASDVYSLGVLLYELLTGERPGRSAEDDPLPASQVVADLQVRKQLRGDIDTILAKALKAKSNERYATVDALAADIDRYLAGEPVLARPDSRRYRLGKFVRKHRWGISASTAILAAIIAGAGVSLWQASQAKGQAELATTSNDFVLSMIQHADPNASQQTREADIALLTAAEERVTKELGNRPEIALKLRVAIGSAYLNRGDFIKATAILRRAVDDASRAMPADNQDLITAQIRLSAWPIVDVDAWGRLASVIQTSKGLGTPGVPQLVDALLARAYLERFVAEGSVGAALVDETMALHFAKKLANDVERSTTAAARVTFLQLGTDVSPQNLLATIEPAYLRARSDPRLGVGHPALLDAQSMYGVVLMQVGRIDEGLAELQDALRVALARHGPKSYVTEKALFALAFSQSDRDLKAAIETQQRAYSIAASNEPPGSLNRAFQARWLSYLLINARHADKAQELHNELAATAERPEFKNHRSFAWFLARRQAQIFLYTGETAKAQEILETLIDKLGESGAFLASAQILLSTALRQNGRFQGTESLAESALNHVRGVQDYCNCNFLAMSLLELAQVKLALKMPADALGLIEQVPVARWAAPIPETADFYVVRGRALLGLGRSAEAREAFRLAHGFWQDFDPESPWAAEAAFWHGQALLATGEIARGRKQMAEMRPRLAASYMPLHRTLAASANSTTSVKP